MRCQEQELFRFDIRRMDFEFHKKNKRTTGKEEHTMKKALSIILALAMVFALCACSSQQPPETTAAATEAPEADPEEKE